MVNTLIPHPRALKLLGGLCTTPVHAEDEEDEGEMTSWISSPRTPMLARLAKAWYQGWKKVTVNIPDDLACQTQGLWVEFELGHEHSSTFHRNHFSEVCFGFARD